MTGAAVAWNDVSTQAVDVAFFAYLAAMVGSFHFLAFRRPLVRRGALALTMLGAAAHLVALVGRGIAADRLPIGNMYEYSLLLTFLLVVAYLVGVERIARVRTLGGFVLAFVVLTLAVAVVFLYVGPAPLVPALDSYWRTVHVTAMIVSSSLLAMCVSKSSQPISFAATRSIISFVIKRSFVS